MLEFLKHIPLDMLTAIQAQPRSPERAATREPGEAVASSCMHLVAVGGEGCWYVVCVNISLRAGVLKFIFQLTCTEM